MVRRTRVRNYEKRDGTEVREHERALAQRDRRDAIIDSARVEHARRRRDEDYAIEQAMDRYADALDEGESHESAVELALDALQEEVNDFDWRATDVDVERLRKELKGELNAVRKRGLSEADSPSTPKGAQRGNKRASRQDDEEERLLSIHDALSDDDEVFSLAELADDPGVKDDQETGRSPERDESLLGYVSSGLNEGAAALKRRRAREAVEKIEPNRGTQRRIEAERRAAERRAESGVDAGGPVGKKGHTEIVYEGGKPVAQEFGPSVSISTVPKQRRRTISSGSADAEPEPARPTKGAGPVRGGDDE